MTRADDLALAQVRASYATAEALEVYRKRVDGGLRTWEATVVQRQFPSAGRVLTIGCGAGRETFALEQRGYDAIGIDISPPRVRRRLPLSSCRFHALGVDALGVAPAPARNVPTTNAPPLPKQRVLVDVSSQSEAPGNGTSTIPAVVRSFVTCISARRAALRSPRFDHGAYATSMQLVIPLSSFGLAPCAVTHTRL